MRRGATALLLGTAVVTLVGTACSRAQNSSGDTGRSALRVGGPAPGFTLPSAQGEEVSLAGFRGNKPVLLYFSMGPG